MKLAYIFKFIWSDIRSYVKLVVPPLLSNNYKGQMGKIMILGGSQDYTGAPYYAGIVYIT